MHRRQGTAGVILAAGYGRRMLPLTERIPKPLLPILGTPLFEIVAERLLRSGARRIHANVHHLADLIEAFVDRSRLPVTLHREAELLGTGGGVGNMADDLDRYELILLQNGDTVSDIDFAPAIALHREREALVTMVVLAGGAESGRGEGSKDGEPPDGGARADDRIRPAGKADSGGPSFAEALLRRPPASILALEDGTVAAIGTRAPEAKRAPTAGYAGMAVLSPEALAYFPRTAGGLIEAVRDIIARRPGSVIVHDAATRGTAPRWGEIGSIGGYLDIHRRILIERSAFDPLIPPPPLPLFAGKDSSIDPGSRWRGFLSVGSKVTIERDVALEDCVVLDGTIVRAGSDFRRAVLYPGGAAV